MRHSCAKENNRQKDSSSLAVQLCLGREGEILACPSHGWEFDLLTGACLTDKRWLQMYEVKVEEDQIIVMI